MGLRALRKHRHVPAAVALMSVLLYTALVTSHIVSQATHRALAAPVADPQTVIAGDADCHDSSSASKAHEPSRDRPASPPRKCPFCTGYGVLNVTDVGGPVTVLTAETLDQLFTSFSGAQLVGPANLPSWHSRAPPMLS